MARMMYFVLSAIAIILLFGILTDIHISINSMANIITVNEEGHLALTFTDFWDNLFDSISGILALSVFTGGLIIVGLYTRGNIENALILVFIVGTLAALVGTFTGVIIEAYNFSSDFVWLRNTIIFLMAMYTFGYVITMVEFFRGNV